MQYKLIRYPFLIIKIINNHFIFIARNPYWQNLLLLNSFNKSSFYYSKYQYCDIIFL